MKAALHALLAILSLMFLTTPVISAAAEAEEPSPQAVLHLLDYVSVEYPQFVQNGRVTNAAEYAEQVEFAGQIERKIQGLPANPQRDDYAGQAAKLLALIEAKADPAQVTRAAQQLQRALITAYNVQVSPRRIPEMRTAAATYAENCAVCHGVNGNGKGPGSIGLDPKPTNFTDATRQSAHSVYALYNTITLGVEGTAMAPFSGLSEEQRWELAFYVS